MRRVLEHLRLSVVAESVASSVASAVIGNRRAPCTRGTVVAVPRTLLLAGTVGPTSRQQALMGQCIRNASYPRHFFTVNLRLFYTALAVK